MAEFNYDATNTANVKSSMGGSGLTAGVQAGLSEVTSLPKSNLQEQQKTHGATFRQDSGNEAAESKNGKNFQFRY